MIFAKNSLRTAQEKARWPALRWVAIAAGSLAGLTAASAGISARRRREEASGDS